MTRTQKSNSRKHKRTPIWPLPGQDHGKLGAKARETARELLKKLPTMYDGPTYGDSLDDLIDDLLFILTSILMTTTE